MFTLLQRICKRELILLYALLGGFLWPEGAEWTRPSIIPVLSAVMALQLMTVSVRTFLRPAGFVTAFWAGLGMNYLLCSGIILGLTLLLIDDVSIRTGFIIIAAAPPAVAITPFAGMLRGNVSFALTGTIAGYVASLALTPVLSLWLLGSSLLNIQALFFVLAKLIILPFIISRVLLALGLEAKLAPQRGNLTNWGFFVVIFTIIGLNKGVILSEPLLLASAISIALAGTFLTAMLLERFFLVFGIKSETVISLVLLGTLKNNGFAGGIALTLFDRRTAIPAAASTVALVFYIIWLMYRRKRQLAGNPQSP